MQFSIRSYPERVFSYRVNKIPCVIYIQKFIFEKNMFFRILCLNMIDTFFFQYDIWKFREIHFQNFEIEKIDVFSKGYSKKSFRYKIFF